MDFYIRCQKQLGEEKPVRSRQRKRELECLLDPIAREFEVLRVAREVVDTLAVKCERALEQTACERLVMAGGVSANQRLRSRVAAMGAARGVEVFYPRPEFCTDNAAMIAYAGWCRLRAGEREPLKFAVRPRWMLADLKPC